MTMNRFFSRKFLVACLVLALGWGLSPSFAQAQAVASTGRVLPDFTDLVEQVGPSVVNIRTLEKVSARESQAGSPDEEMQELFRRFFGVPMPAPNSPRQQRPNRPQPEQEQPRGVGSGFTAYATFSRSSRAFAALGRSSQPTSDTARSRSRIKPTPCLQEGSSGRQCFTPDSTSAPLQ